MLSNIKQQFSGWLGNTTNRYLMLILLLACINFTIAFTWSLPQVTSPEAASPWPVDTITALKKRQPQYILVLKGIGVTGDPNQIDNHKVKKYFSDLLGEKYNFIIGKRFSTPNILPFRQVTAGTMPISILLKRK